MLDKTEKALRQRLKELDCLYGISHLLEKDNLTRDELFQGTVDLMVKYWKYPDIVSIRIVFDGVEYFSSASKISCDNCLSSQRSNINVYGEISGYVGVCYCKEIPVPNEDVILGEERSLLDVISRRLGRIIEKKQSEEALLESEAKFRSYVESAPDGIFVSDQYGNYIDVNKAACNITGYGRDELLKMSLVDITFEEDRERGKTDFNECKIKGSISGEYRYIHKDGSIRHWSVDVASISGTRIVGFTRDITDNMKMIEQIRQMEKMDAVGQLAGGIAHDFNNQIAVIMGYSEMLVNKLEDPKLLKFAKNILASSHRSDDLTRKLLAFAHKGLYEAVPVNLHKVIGEAVNILSHSVDKKISIKLRLNANPYFTLGDPSQIQNILLNLALNSRDAMPDGGEILFETDNTSLDEDYCKAIPYEVLPGPFVLITVSDNGMGIDQKYLNRIFELFFTTKELGKGTGMGLASVYGAVSNHHGIIEVSSSPQTGTVFSLYFPITDQPVTVPKSSFSISEKKGSATILLVDDDELVLDMGQEMLSGLGYEVMTSRDGIQAVDFYRKNWGNIDLVVLDMIMPGMGGKDVYRLLLEINPLVSVILSSGFSLTGEVQQLLDERVKAFVGKPFESIVISQVIGDALQGN